jgi:DNA-binding MarR family transcriptional regulator
MSKHTSGVDRRTQALAELRAFGADVDRLDGAAAARLGLNRTDMRVMELLNRVGPMIASELAVATELTGAAVTTVIDRLQDRDLVTRRYDPADRRRVLVEPTARAADVSRALFADLLAGVRDLLVGYSDDELATIISFISGTRAVFDNQIESLRRGRATELLARTAAPAPRPPRPTSPRRPPTNPTSGQPRRSGRASPRVEPDAPDS